MGTTQLPPRPTTLRNSHTCQTQTKADTQELLATPTPCSLRQRSRANLACRIRLQALSLTSARTETRRWGKGEATPIPTLSHPPQGEARPPARPWPKACARAHTHTRDTPPPPSAHSSFQGVGTRSPQTRAPARACALCGLAKRVPESERRARPVSAGLPCNRDPGDTLQRPSPLDRVPPKLTGDQKAREDGESVHGAAALRRLQCRSSADRAAINLPPSPDADASAQARAPPQLGAA